MCALSVVFEGRGQTQGNVFLSMQASSQIHCRSLVSSGGGEEPTCLSQIPKASATNGSQPYSLEGRIEDTKLVVA